MDGVQAVPEGQMRRRVEQPQAARRLKVAPQFPGTHGHRHVAGIAVAQPEDPATAVRTAGRMTDLGLLQDGYLAPAAGQHSRGSQAEQAGPDDDELAALRHDLSPGAVREPRAAPVTTRGRAIRLAAAARCRAWCPGRDPGRPRYRPAAGRRRVLP